MDEFAPPSCPPPLLNDGQWVSLVEQGFVDLALPPHQAQLHENLLTCANTFFGYPLEVKKRAFPTNVQHTEQGYYFVPKEKQYLTFRHAAHQKEAVPHCQELVPLVADVWSGSASLLHRILSDIGSHLDFPTHAWDAILEGCRELPASADAATPSLMRVFKYLPDSGIATAHRDLGLLTLCVGSDRGLQVQAYADDQTTDRIWTDSTNVTVLAGDALHVLSSGRITSGMHRVVATSSGRNSIVFALRINLRSTIDLSLFGGHGIQSAAELWENLTRGRINVNAQTQVREKQRAELLAAV